MSRQYHTLESEKYFTTSLLSDQQHSRSKARKMLTDCIVNCMIAIAFCVAAFFAIKTMPTWLPEAQAWFHQMTNYRYF